jgi:photosystem II stability/assembly factor-like uncharacterized protein
LTLGLLFGLSGILITGARCKNDTSSPPIPLTEVAPELLRGLEWRAVGPAVFGGRVTDVAGVPGQPHIIYVAHASAGLFKSTNGGTTFQSIFDDAGTQSIGAIALAPDDPDTIYVGTGEGKPRNSVSYGDGIYRSTDGGKSWKNLGLRNSERFSRIVVDPHDTNIVYAAAMGHEWGPNKERGLFRSLDGGITWKDVLFVNDTTGACDVCLDPKNPRIVYAAMYDYLREPWHFRSGGPGSGLYRSSDGGESWVRLTDPSLKNGLPTSGPLGRIGIAVCIGNENVVYAMIESENEGELWRSDDRGTTWKAVSYNPEINARPFYFSVIRVDPADENRVYSLNRSMWLSTDGGKNFKEIGYWKIFGDHHALWIDPSNPDRLLNGSDGGFHISYDRGANWEFINTLPFAQAYHVAVDMADPYHVLGGFQDHEVWRGPNEKYNVRGVKGGDWVRLRDHGDGMYVLADPRDPNIIYYNCENGDITRMDLRTGEERFIQPYPVAPAGVSAAARLYRFNWNSPIHISSTDPDVIYFGGNVLFKTHNGGDTWTIMSPDLTKNDKEKQTLSGGPITADNTGAEIYGTITSISESPGDQKVVWVGTDDGNVQLTRDGGRTWTNLAANIPELPPNSWVSAVWASKHSVGTAYLTIDQHRLDDFAAYVFMTADFGNTWKKISDGLPSYVHIIMEDPREPNLLYAGTEQGIFATFDQGRSWTGLNLRLPPLSVVDLKIHPRDNDLIMATHARGIYILDDVTPLQELARTLDETAAIFKPVRATRYTPMSDVSSLSDQVFFARNKPYGAIISYYLSPEASQTSGINLEILNPSGRIIRTLRGTGHPGVNCVVWGLREDPVASFEDMQDEVWFNPRVDGPRVLPGEFRVRISVLGETLEQTFEVRLDPRIKIKKKELDSYDRAVRKLAGMQLSVNEALARIQLVDRQLFELEKRQVGGDIKTKAGEIRRALATVRDEFRPNPRFPETLSLGIRISTLRQQVENCTAPPTRAQAEWIETFDEQLNQVLGQLQELLEDGLGSLNQRLREAGIAPLDIKKKAST